MKLTEVYKTADGILHDTAGDARRHLESKYGEMLTALAIRLTKAEKYHKILELLTQETETMRALVANRDDLKLEPEE